MKPDPLLSSWIIEALSAPATSKTQLHVAKHVWTHHEQEIRAQGDRLFTWQLDLQATADEMVEAGTLTIADGEWALSSGEPRQPGRGKWSDDEIATAVEGYVAMLRAEHAGQSMRRTQVVNDIAARTGRSADQLEAMMSNISAVVQEHGLMPLGAYRPRSNVPAGVRPAVAAALDA